MKKIHALFLYSMLASAPMYGMMANIFCICLAVAPYAKSFLMTQNGDVNVFAVRDGANTIGHYLSLCWAKIDYFFGDKCGIWKSQHALKKEKEQVRHEERIQNFKTQLINEKNEELLKQRERFLGEINTLKNQLREFERQAVLNQQIDLLQKKHAEEISLMKQQYAQEKKMVIEANKQLAQKMSTIENHTVIENLKKENLILQEKLKGLSKANNFSSFTTFAVTPSVDRLPPT
ncbi:MAG TPA: hypothetical protein VL201_01390, partial [Patescibacteria group bacterium]|nr:hypothetical protein [Patescibacteria group bacterium]